ncbi:hypothetical protein [Streptomyces macrosporus]|uniref:Uncharacterized protein n=1 Tax=Streptomyces macrosporus TaxID=44032 RepID=A0ABP5XFZ0_9ACTN
MTRTSSASVVDHLAPHGRLLSFVFFFGSSGDPASARMLTDQSGLRRAMAARLERERDGRQVEYGAYRLSR